MLTLLGATVNNYYLSACATTKYYYNIGILCTERESRGASCSLCRRHLHKIT